MKRKAACLIICWLFSALAAAAWAQWAGIDETIVGQIAADHGRPARAPLINTDQGDLLLFVFLAAGAVGGFAAGYYYRGLTAP